MYGDAWSMSDLYWLNHSTVSILMYQPTVRNTTVLVVTTLSLSVRMTLRVYERVCVLERKVVCVCVCVILSGPF